MKRILSRTLLSLSCVAAVACGDSQTGPSGTVTIRLTDTPFADAKAVLVTFSEVSAHRSDGDWATLPFSPASSTRTCDLKKLAGAQDVLGTGPLTEGHYTQLRLMITSASLYWDNPATGPPCAATVDVPAGRSSSLDIPSGEIKLNREFDVTAAGATTITLDFDGDKSIIETGNGQFKLSPVISVVSVQ
jgi:hypothetical protein